MIVSLSDVSYMSDVLDCEVMHSVVVAKTNSGLWYCNSVQPRHMSMQEVPFYEALPWMTKRWAQITGTGKAHENDQLEDIKIREFARIEIEEMHSTPIDTYGSNFEDIMQGASSNEYLGHSFEL